MWLEFLGNLSKEFKFADGATWSSLEIAQEKLAVRFPASLVELLQETDGVTCEYDCAFLWPVERIISDNLQFRDYTGFREIYMPFDHLLFFADAGNGDQFAFTSAANGVIRRHDVFAWNHEDDSRTWVAPTLQKFVEWWTTGKIKI